MFSEPPVVVVVDSSNIATIVAADDAAKKKFEKDNKTVRGHLLNHMTNSLFWFVYNL